MPTNRKRRTHGQREAYRGLTPEVERTLKTGLCFLYNLRPSLDVLKQAWKEHGAQTTAEWIEEHPGTRPFGWWLFVGVPKYGERRTTEYFRRHHADHRDGLLKYDILQTHTVPAMQEPEIDYLRRHGVLSEEEANLTVCCGGGHFHHSCEKGNCVCRK